jgi:hypothetical protein
MGAAALYVSIAALVIACLALALVLFWRCLDWALTAVQPPPVFADNTAVILDSIDGVRDQVDNAGMHTQLEHAAIIKEQEKTSGRLQFLVAKDIAAELGNQRAAEAQQRRDAE